MKDTELCVITIKIHCNLVASYCLVGKSITLADGSAVFWCLQCYIWRWWPYGYISEQYLRASTAAQ